MKYPFKKYQLVKVQLTGVLLTGGGRIKDGDIGIVYQRKRDGTLWVWILGFGSAFRSPHDFKAIPEEDYPLYLNKHKYIDEAIANTFKRKNRSGSISR